MKKLLTNLLLLSATVSMLWSCQKDQAMDVYQGGTAPVLTASVSTTIPLAYSTAANEAVKLSWTNPAYQFASGISSQDVSYLVEIDTSGANFTNPNKKTLSFSKDLGVSISQSSLNDYLLNQLLLNTTMAHNIEIRVTATINNTTATKLVSNVLKFTVTPYAIPPKVAPPTTGNLYLVGSATAGGWSNPVPVPSQQFTKVSTTFYTITVTLIGGQEYLFLPLNGDWGHKFACNKTTSPPDGNIGGDFGYDWNDNFPGPTTNGTYKIDVDFQRGKFIVTKQ
ncbi:MAG: SusE domain-containing protein [Bacteroidetes bacterium]|nr:SusE domain-containing protein [Bacteroidota bacterium]MBS1591483.1 SusE domain-containing protein [Bacteroidota bacterium]MBS1639966.1 SusE domain-containing protein [Bacteroidota bacterium]MBS1640904.1 SusE domain-containing protein [Bacteroidota bacterium]MBS1669964.1 SusE domain-containing protein [Bacteroidota bacterium]